MSVTIDRELCVGVGNCEANGSGIFRVDGENGVAFGAVHSVDDGVVSEAAESCQTSAIIVGDDNGDQLHP